MKTFSIAAILFIFLIASIPSLYGCSKSTPTKLVSAHGDTVTIDAAGIENGGLKFFSYNVGPRSVRFFLVRTESGKLKAALDACATCYINKMGYHADAGCVVCGYCGNRFDFDEMDKGVGGCYPIMLKSRIDGGRVVLDKKELEEAVKWF